MSMRQLNLGCGTDIRPGWINVDRVPLPGVDLIFDLERIPLPFESGSIDAVEAKDVLEHIEYIPLIRDVHRLLKPGGELYIQVPHFSSVYSYVDPTHRKLFSIRTFEFFVSNSEFGRDYYFDFTFSRIKDRHIYFPWGRPWVGLVEWLVNRSDASRFLFECSALSRMVPAGNIRLTLVK